MSLINLATCIWPADRDEANPTVKASGSALGVSREIPISMLGDGYHSNPCDSDADDSGIQCPLKANTENSYTLKLPITSEMKRVSHICDGH